MSLLASACSNNKLRSCGRKTTGRIDAGSIDCLRIVQLAPVINSRIIYRGKDKIEQQSMPLFDYVSIGDKEVPTMKLPVYFESPDSVSSSYATRHMANATTIAGR